MEDALSFPHYIQRACARPVWYDIRRTPAREHPRRLEAYSMPLSRRAFLQLSSAAAFAPKWARLMPANGPAHRRPLSQTGLRSSSSAIPSSSRAQLDERSQRSHLFHGPLSHVPSIQPSSRSLGQHELGARHQPRHDPLGTRAHRAFPHSRRSRPRRRFQR